MRFEFVLLDHIGAMIGLPLIPHVYPHGANGVRLEVWLPHEEWVTRIRSIETFADNVSLGAHHLDPMRNTRWPLPPGSNNYLTTYVRFQ